MSRLGETPSQTVGPYFSMRLGAVGQNVVVSPDGTGEHIVITGTVYDGDRQHVEDALIETWQANPAGRYNHPDDRRRLPLHPAFTGFARVMTDFASGAYRIETVKPGPVPDPEEEPQAPHVSVILQARGMLDALYTRIYFSDEAEANERDFVLRSVPTDRRHTLVAERVDGSDPAEYRFDIRIQGDDETVFFDI